MRLYADHPDRRAGQIIADILSMAAIVGAEVAGVVLHAPSTGWPSPPGDGTDRCIVLARTELDRLGLDYRVLPDPGHEASTGRSES